MSVNAPSFRVLCALEDVVLQAMSEEEYADWLGSCGQAVIRHRGRRWEAMAPGLYRPVHWLGRLRYRDATRPGVCCWGFRAALAEEDRHLANATMPVHLVADLHGYTFENLPSGRRRKIRNCLNDHKVARIMSPAVLLEQGYEILASAHRRHGYGELPTRDRYRMLVEDCFRAKGALVLGAFVDGRLGGYTVSHLVEGTLYGTDGVFATEALGANLPSCLDFVLMDLCRRSGIVGEVSLGLDTPERPSLVKYKAEMGFPVVHLPARVGFAPLFGAALRLIYPFKYYRLTGRLPPRAKHRD